VVYYFYAAFRATREPAGDVIFSVPTGNFGDIFAGYIAKRMGLNINKLLLATNENNILTRFINEGDYSLTQVVPTVSPSMDIQVASNFERYLYYLFDENPEAVRRAFESFAENGLMNFSLDQRRRVGEEFLSRSVTQDETLKTIASFHAETGYLLDPHTAVGVKAALDFTSWEIPLVCLATAHPAKFDEAVIKATGIVPERPAVLKGIEQLPTRCEVMENDPAAVRAFIENHAI
jgi:threonine synthase